MNLDAFMTRLAKLMFRGLDSGTASPAINHSPWHALPGNRLELSDTGFAIELRSSPNEQPYLLIDPEGRSVARSQELAPLKGYGEQRARERDEFKL